MKRKIMDSITSDAGPFIRLMSPSVLKSTEIGDYDFSQHQRIDSILVSRTKSEKPQYFAVAWSDNGISGIDGPYKIYPGLRKAMRKAGALDIWGRVRPTALQTN